MLDEVKKEFKEYYDANYLIPEFGEGRSRERLLSGLEESLERIQFPEGVQMGRELMNQNIDFGAICEIADSIHARCVGTRMRNILRLLKIETYENLVEFAKKRKAERGRYRMQKGVRMVYLRDGWRGSLGEKSHKVLYTHLLEKGVELFKDGYRSEELIKGSNKD